MNEREYPLSKDKFDNATVLKDDKAIITWIVRLILMNPGDIQTHPEMGVGLVKNYRYSWSDVVEKELSDKIMDQVSVYLPQYAIVDIQCKVIGVMLYIMIYTENNSYTLGSEEGSGELKLLS